MTAFDKWFKSYMGRMPPSRAQHHRLVQNLVHALLQMKKLQRQIDQLRQDVNNSKHAQEVYSTARAVWKALHEQDAK